MWAHIPSAERHCWSMHLGLGCQEMMITIPSIRIQVQSHRRVQDLSQE